MIEITRTTKNKIMLHDGEFEYHFNSKSQTRMYWICSRADICSARLTTNIIGEDNAIIVYKSTCHSHVAEPCSISIRELKNSIKEKALANPNACPSGIIQEAIRPIIDDDVLSGLTEKISLVRTVNKVQNQTRPRIPQYSFECEIIEPYNQTYHGNRFLRYDSGVLDSERVLVFYSDLGLRSLIRSENIFVDGTFDTVPKIFLQLYTVHGTVFGYTFPLIYVLCSRKSKETYKKIFSHLKEAARAIGYNLNPESIMMDFEKASIGAASECFPSARVKGCLFHFNQSLWRKVQQIGLSAEYMSHKTRYIKEYILRFMALPFVPEEDLIDTFKMLSERSPAILDGFKAYLGRNYIGVELRGDHWNSVQPIFNASLWNCFNSVISGSRRTNNAVEGWHSRLQKAVVSKDATIWKFLDFVRNDERDNEILIRQLASAHTKIRHPIKKRSLINNARIGIIAGSYSEFKRNDQILDYLLNIGRLLKNNFISNETVENNQQEENE